MLSQGASDYVEVRGALARFPSFPVVKGWDGGSYAFMSRVLATDHAHAIYKKRPATVEVVFGQIKHNRGIDCFQRRGRSAVRSEWRLAAATHNLLKLHTPISHPQGPETAQTGPIRSSKRPIRPSPSRSAIPAWSTASTDIHQINYPTATARRGSVADLRFSAVQAGVPRAAALPCVRRMAREPVRGHVARAPIGLLRSLLRQLPTCSR
jgi:hypothetical protein